MTERETPAGEPADPRTLFAAERTLLAWVRTGLALMGFGFVVARFGLFLRELASMQGAPDRGAGVQLPPQQQVSVSLWAGVALVLLGVIVSLLAAYEHWKHVQRLNRGEALSFRRLSLGVLLAIALGIIGLVISLYLTMGLGHT